MQIGELSRSTGVDVETIRYYEKESLLTAPQRSSNGYRAYGREQLEQLAFIRHCRALDIPLIEIRRLLAFAGQTNGHCHDIDELIDAHLARVRARLDSMRALEAQLSQLRARCHAPQTGQCGILDELIAAAHGEACACHPAPRPDTTA